MCWGKAIPDEVPAHLHADGSEESRPRHFRSECADPDCPICPHWWRERNRLEVMINQRGAA